MNNNNMDNTIQEADARERRQFRYWRWFFKGVFWFILALYLLWLYLTCS